MSQGDNQISIKQEPNIKTEPGAVVIKPPNPPTPSKSNVPRVKKGLKC